MLMCVCFGKWDKKMRGEGKVIAFREGTRPDYVEIVLLVQVTTFCQFLCMLE